MKILQINAVNKISSTGRNVHELNTCFEQKGDLCVAAFSEGKLTDPAREYIIGSNFGRKLHALFSRISGKQGYFSTLATKDLLGMMKTLTPDVVILNNLHGNFINLPLLLDYLAKNDIPTVAVLHDCWFYTGKCCHYTLCGCSKWKELCNDCPALKTYNKSWFFDKTEQMHKDKIRLFGAIPRLAVVGVSDWITNEAKNSPVFKNAKTVKRIYNWIDTDVFSPSDPYDLKYLHRLDSEKIILCVASGWSAEKGLDTVKYIADNLKNDERLIVVGDMPDGVRFNKNVITVPKTDSVETLVDYYSLADVFVQPSLQETFGKVTAEALACGTPVITFDSTANPELVGENCGAAVPFGDNAKMLAEIRTVLSNGKAYYKDSCTAFAATNFSKQKSLDEYYELIGNLL